MSAQILDGGATAKTIANDLIAEVSRLSERTGKRPVLATVIVGDDSASHTYVRMKVARCKKVGIEPRQITLPAESSTEQVTREVRKLSEDDSVDGILVQHPAPVQVDEKQVFEAIDPGKDVDGVTSGSLAAMAFKEQGFRSATPGGIMRLLEEYGIELAGRRAVVVGRSRILGIPMGLLLLAENATVTYCHSKTTDLKQQVSRADVVVAAAGRPGLIAGDWIKQDAVVVDAGYADNSGDVEFDAAAERASWITPVPGGVGPMTIACLLGQTVESHRRRHGPG
ncbi:bifunctional 5,10-methylenetetrahydrofolate dehydrogenase/5,10-methenyltetrahydrofolate cyclohydrolase [Brevibacterium sp. UCMA 11752]|uniref:bifunctional 5,10-methylenetetrahydrofolate dehydrogenase/5,10-methenyltetrahydrofolate cyclohydrolase n=1 Tax=Brevibacterium sp. UCMA 11752 TaxID=2745946 RepID=UPI001F1C2B6E|nr:bifunctional 5,10-methylenetetrahydrofolate dehydrogenase/5,10-methenyltetrahydrofolate cyclohydrolase [Brevibacterium sp. UCMA 11752]MCF2585789.1 bifunctional 5,10-methylenetetrahydrofolate dehydrogenase/5,10-methenyltetrahydrofolate cyclohydrolase [Brevibacterium sp. UCMA 11752]